MQASLGLVVIDALGAFAIWYWVGVGGEWHDAVSGRTWIRAYARAPRQAWLIAAPMGLMATLVLLLWLGI